MSDYEISENGVYVDLATGQVVDSPPENGVLLCPPGGQLDPERQKAIEDAKAAAPQVVEESVTDPEPAGEAKPKRASRAKADA